MSRSWVHTPPTTPEPGVRYRCGGPRCRVPVPGAAARERASGTGAAAQEPVPAPALSGRPQPVPDREDADVQAVGDQPPQAAPREQGDRDGDQAEDDEVPGPMRGERLLLGVEDD